MEEVRKLLTKQRRPQRACSSATFVASFLIHAILGLGLFLFGPLMPMRASTILSNLLVANPEPVCEIEDVEEPLSELEEPELEEALEEPEIEEPEVLLRESEPEPEVLVDDPPMSDPLRESVPASAWLANVFRQKKEVEPERTKPIEPKVVEASFAEPEPLVGDNLPPRYPKAAVDMQIEGEALIEVEVAADGSVLKLHLARSSGSKLLDRAALAAVRKWRFTRVAGVIQIPILFTLRDRR